MFLLIYYSIFITYHSNMEGSMLGVLIWICFQFQFSSLITHQNE